MTINIKFCYNYIIFTDYKNKHIDVYSSVLYIQENSFMKMY